MPELPDVEGFRRFYNRHAAGQRVRAANGIDPTMLRTGTAQTFGRALKGRRLEGARRHGKLLICPAGGPTLVLHFGMTGMLAWCEGEARHRHDRLVLELSEGELRYRNMRKFGGIWLVDDDGLAELTGRLGPDWLELDRVQFERLIARRRLAIKGALMDQTLAAGLGNLTADESLFRARIDPRRPACALDSGERRRLYSSIRRVLDDSLPYGLVPAKPKWLTRARDERPGRCPRCGATLERTRIGGRTTAFCPREQH
jgi:formamidopyrimidine-DNA glycosylase